MSRYHLCLIAWVLVAACEKSSAPSAAPKPPTNLVAIVHVPSLERATAAAESYADKVMPGASLLARNVIDAALRQAPGLSRTEPAALFVLAATGAPPQLGLVATVANAKELDAAPKNGLERKRRGNRVLLADAATLGVAGDWALAALPATRALPAGAVARAEVMPRVAERLARAQLAQARATMKKALASAEAADTASTVELALDASDSFLDLLLQLERIELLAFVDADRVELVLDTTATAKTALAGFAAAQRPSDLAHLERLPLEGTSVLAAGRVVLGPAADAVWSWVDRLLARTRFRPLLGELRKVVELTDGTFAFAGSGNAMAMDMSVLYGVSDAAQASAALASSIDKLRAAGPLVMRVPPVSMRSELTPDTTTAEGVRLHHLITTYDYGTEVPPEVLAGMPTRQELAWGVWDRVMGMATAGHIEALIARSRRPSPVPAGFAPLLDQARARKASAVEVIDYGAFFTAMLPNVEPTSAPMSIWLAFPEGKLSLGIVVPSASVASVARAMQGMTQGN